MGGQGGDLGRRGGEGDGSGDGWEGEVWGWALGVEVEELDFGEEGVCGGVDWDIGMIGRWEGSNDGV